jgi:hypothetical protein
MTSARPQLRRLVHCVAALFVAHATGACSFSSHFDPASGDRGRFAFEQLEHAGGDLKIRTFDDISELLLNTRFHRPGEEPAPLMAAVVVGHIATVIPGHAYSWSEEGRTEVPFDGAAMSRTLFLHVAVDEEIGSTDVPDRVTVGLSIGGATDPVRMVRSLETSGPLLLFLDQPGPVFQDEPNLFSLADGGELITTIAEDGRLALPASEWPEVQGDLRTIDDVRRAAQQPQRTIALTQIGERAEGA